MIRFLQSPALLRDLKIKAKDAELETTVFLAAVRMCILDDNIPALRGLDIQFYSKLSTKLDVIDIKNVQALVGMVPVGPSSWAIIDRSGSLAQAIWWEDDVDDDN